MDNKYLIIASSAPSPLLRELKASEALKKTIPLPPLSPISRLCKGTKEM